MSPMTRPERLLSLSGPLGHRFSDPGLLENALTHRSFANEVREPAVRDNERLEFLGDAVIDLFVSEKLYAARPDWTEGELSRARASLVNEKALADLARKLGLGDLLRLGKGEGRTGGRHKDSILCGAMEAVVGSVYLDGGIEAAWTSLDGLLDTRMSGAAGVRRLGGDAKTALQEALAGGSAPPPRYAVRAEQGPPHQRTFTVAVTRDGDLLALGSGSSKKQAEQRAAAAALIHLRRMES